MRGYGYWIVAAALLCAFSTGACGDDDDNDDGAAGSAGNSGATGSGGAGNVSCTPSDKGACTNANDCPKVESGEIRMAAQTCGLGCLADDDPGTCAVTCIVMDTSASPACSACYAGLVKCASDMCLAECAAAPSSAACNQCQIAKGCRSTFDMCSGLTSS